MAKKESGREISVLLDSHAFPHSFYFNRFYIEPFEGGHRLMQFAFMVGGATMNTYSVVLEHDAIEQSRKTMLDFLGKMGTASKSKPEQWRPARESQRVDISNIYQMSRAGNVGEIRFGIYAIGTALDAARKEGGPVTISAQPVALLHCDLDLLRLLITQIFA